MKSPLTLPQLKQECHSLIEQIAHKPASIKLLVSVREMLQRFAGYKANRFTDFSRRRNHE